MGDFIGSPLFFVVGVVLLLGLVGLMIFLQKRQKDED
jgi:LPXTG-motif cell wall-anchored protein